jgi:hypothetical protein
LPAGLTNYYEDHWLQLRDKDRSAWLAYKLPILRVLASAPEAVSLRLLSDRLPGIPKDTIREVLTHDWRQFLERTACRESGKMSTRWRLYHPSFADFLRNKSADPDEHIDLEQDRDAWFEYGRQHGHTPD